MLKLAQNRILLSVLFVTRNHQLISLRYRPVNARAIYAVDMKSSTPRTQNNDHSCSAGNEVQQKFSFFLRRTTSLQGISLSLGSRGC